MPNLAINDFKAKLSGGGARNNLFQVTMSFPSYAQGDVSLTSFMVKATSLPSSIISPITVPFRGRQLQLAGDRAFEPWGVTVINDTNFKVRNSFERWMNGINAHTANVGFTNPTDYMRDAIIDQLDKTGSVIKRYDIRGAFPTQLSAIDLSYDSENTIEEFCVEFQITYWEARGITT